VYRLLNPLSFVVFKMGRLRGVRPVQSTASSEGRIRKAGFRPLVALAARKRDNLKLIARGPIPDEQNAGRRPPIFRRLARGGVFDIGHGGLFGYELEETTEEFHMFIHRGQLANGLAVPFGSISRSAIWYK
jgi:hypothetical protein